VFVWKSQGLQGEWAREQPKRVKASRKKTEQKKKHKTERKTKRKNNEKMSATTGGNCPECSVHRVRKTTNRNCINTQSEPCKDYTISVYDWSQIMTEVDAESSSTASIDAQSSIVRVTQTHH